MLSRIGRAILKVLGYGEHTPSREMADDSYESPHGLRLDPDTNEPLKSYEKKVGAFFRDQLKKLEIPDPFRPITPDKVRIVCISDTHSKTKNLEIPPGDILLHSGDFSTRGKLEEIQQFADFMRKQPHKHKVIIAGNHEIGFGVCDGYIEPLTLERLWGQSGAQTFSQKMKDVGINHPKELLKDFIYLNNSSATVCGLKFWGSPWTPYFHGWAYNYVRGTEGLMIWDTIPSDTDILVTHGPPLGIGDKTMMGDRAGCVELLNTVRSRVQPKLHVFGHIHEDYGLRTDGTTMYANASICTIMYRPTQRPICIDIDLPPGCSKDNVVVDLNTSAEKVVSAVYNYQKEVAKSQEKARASMTNVLAQINLNKEQGD